MAGIHNIFGVVIMSLVLAFAVIHLGVAIGIIASDRQHQDIFRPQVGLASFNLVISLLAFLTGVLGMVSVLKNADQLGRVGVLVAGTLVLFTIASLITALVINAKSLGYLSTHVSNHITQYKTSATSSDIINRLQMNYGCCGDNLWIDWTRAELNVIPFTDTNATSISSTTSAQSGNARKIGEAQHDLADLSYGQSARLARQVRQAVQSYSTIPDLPLSFGVTLPASCCMLGAAFTNDASGSYCLSNANGVENLFYATGCTQSLDVTAGNQAMGIGVINCILIILALVTMPVLLITNPDL